MGVFLKTRAVTTCLCLLLMAHLSHGFSLKLKHLSTVYLPQEVPAGGDLEYRFDVDAAERAVYESSGKMIYAIGKHALHVINASDPNKLNRVDTFPYGRELTDVAVCGGAVFVAFIEGADPLQGGVIQYGVYNAKQGMMPFTRSITFNEDAQPDKLVATKNCTLIVALENGPVKVNSVWQDPPGRVGIISFPRFSSLGVSADPTVSTLDFTAFDSRFDELSGSGVRWVYRRNNKFSDDLEPEYVVLNADHTKAYVSFQENNAIAVMDLQTKTITDLYGLGFKNWNASKLDPSDDSSIKMAAWGVYGIYQPDGIEWFRWENKDYIITANEGDSKDVDDFKDYKRGHSFSASGYADSVSNDMRTALETNSQLGRLYLSTIDGKNQQDKFEKFYTFGARSFSIWRASDMVQVYDSGSELGEKVAELRRELFNNKIDGGSTVASGMDKRSDDKGVEPESVAVATLGGRLVFFVGLERPGMIAVYTVAPGTGMTPKFETLYTDGIPTGGKTWDQMYADRTLHAVDPETISVIPANSGLADYPIVLVTGVVSGTVSLLKVDVTPDPTGSTTTADPTGSTTTAGPVLSTMICCLLLVTMLIRHN